MKIGDVVLVILDKEEMNRRNAYNNADEYSLDKCHISVVDRVDPRCQEILLRHNYDIPGTWLRYSFVKILKVKR